MSLQNCFWFTLKDWFWACILPNIIRYWQPNTSELCFVTYQTKYSHISSSKPGTIYTGCPPKLCHSFFPVSFLGILSSYNWNLSLSPVYAVMLMLIIVFQAGFFLSATIMTRIQNLNQNNIRSVSQTCKQCLARNHLKCSSIGWFW